MFRCLGHLDLSGAVDRSVDSREQRSILHRFSETGYKVTFAESFKQHSVAMRSDEDRRNFYAVAEQMLLKLQTVHLRHLEIDNQACRKTVG